MNVPRSTALVICAALVLVAGLTLARWGAKGPGASGEVEVRGSELGWSPLTLELVSYRGERAHACPARDEPTAERLQCAAWLVFSSLSPDSREKLLDGSEALLDHLEASAHPMLVTLEETPWAEVRSEVAWVYPIWAAAEHVTRTCFRTGDGAVTVRVPGESEPLAGGVSFSPEAARVADGFLVERFLSWSISSSRLLRLGAESTSQLNALRRRSVLADSTLALVLEQTSFDADAELWRQLHPRVQAIVERLDRLAARLPTRHPLVLLFRGASLGPPERSCLPWLQLEASTVLVVPKLSAASRSEALSRELSEWGASKVEADGD